MTVAVHNSLYLMLAHAFSRLPTFADFLRALNRDEGLRDGSRYL